MSNNKNVHFSSAKDDWGTPKEIFKPLNDLFKFDLDPCATPENALCKNFFTPEVNGLEQSWDGHRVFLNPPYGREIGKWLAKAVTIKHGLVIGLIPARTCSEWWHEYVLKANCLMFLKRRVKFVGAPDDAPFPSVIALWTDQEIFALQVDTWAYKTEPSLKEKFIANYAPARGKA